MVIPGARACVRAWVGVVAHGGQAEVEWLLRTMARGGRVQPDIALWVALHRTWLRLRQAGAAVSALEEARAVRLLTAPARWLTDSHVPVAAAARPAGRAATPGWLRGRSLAAACLPAGLCMPRLPEGLGPRGAAAPTPMIDLQ